MIEFDKYIAKQKVKKEIDNSPVEIFAVLSNKNFNLLQAGYATIEVPYGVKMVNRAGTRRLTFTCPDKETAQELMDGLDDSGISWQEM